MLRMRLFLFDLTGQPVLRKMDVTPYGVYSGYAGEEEGEKVGIGRD